MNIKVNTDRMWSRLMEMAKIGATPRGGVCRLALSEEDKAGRDLFVKWCKEAGCEVTIDELGNIFARREGRDAARPAILVGSHLDSQPTGGKYDGVLGVLAGLEILETLNDHNITTHAPIEIVSWTNEEGARFAPAMLASGAFAGVFSKEYAESRKDRDGITFKKALENIGYAGKRALGSGSYAASFELHIEQGPVLESEDITVGVVHGVQGIRWYDLTMQGVEAHAGPTPMSFRKDPVQHLMPLLNSIYEIASEYSPNARVTIGNIKAVPGVHNTVPGELKVAVDLRHPDRDTLEIMHEKLSVLTQQAGTTEGIVTSLDQIWYSPPVHFDKQCITALQNAAASLGTEYLDMVSGAGHDSVYLAGIIPAAMVFIPCRDGLSHNEMEHIEKKHAEAGCNVLLRAVIQQANASENINSL